MNILYIISGCNMGGATFSFLTLLEEAKKEGHVVSVIIPNDSETDDFKARLDSMGVPSFVIDLTFNSYPNIDYVHHFLGFVKVLLLNQIAERKAIRRVSQIAKDIKADIIHTNVGPLDIGHFAAKRCGIPHVWHIREYGDRDFIIRMFPSKRAFRKRLSEDYVITITKDLLSYNRQENNPKATVIYNGVRSENEIYIDLPKEKFFLSASRISPEKGFSEMVSCFNQFYLDHTDYRLIILGEGPADYVAQLKAEINSLSCKDNVVFLGYTEDVTSWMRKATALLVSSSSEGFGRMTAEAAFAGCIVIGRNQAGTKEILDITGGYPYLTEEEFISAMNDAATLTQTSYREKVRAAQEAAKKLYSREVYVRNVMSVYDKAIKHSL